MQQNKQYYDKFYSTYPVDVHDNPARFNVVSKLLKGKVLDVACGTGTLADYYRGPYYGLDISDVAIEKAKSVRRNDAVFAVSDFTKEKLGQSNFYDSVYLGEFLEHIEDDTFVFENILDVLKPDGLIVVSVPNGDRVPDESHCRIFTVAQIRKEYSKYGKITFHNWSGFQKRIIFTIEPAKKNQNELSLVMIVKDEEKGIEKAIISCLNLVDRVVISVDSKSQDRTKEIAAMYADELKEHVWQDDFSKARNFAQENVKTNWILFIDGHEYVENYGDIRQKMTHAVDGIFVTVRMESGMTFLFPRVYRSHIKFKNAVHNINECRTRRSAPTFVIVHDRVHGQSKQSTQRREEQRKQMMPKELKKELKKNPRNSRAHFHLANFYMMRQEVKLALKHYKQVIKHGKSPDEKFLSLLHYGALQMSLGHWWRALWNFNKAQKLQPERWEVARVIGGFYYQQKHWKNALPYLVRALQPNKRRYSYQPMKINLVETWDMIGHCFAQLDQNDKAIVAWQRALEIETDKKRRNFIKQKIELVKPLLTVKQKVDFSELEASVERQKENLKK